MKDSAVHSSVSKQALSYCCRVALIAGIFLAASVAYADDEQIEPPPAAGVWAAQVSGFQVIEAVLPESPLAAAVWPGGGLAVLTRTEDDEESPRHLYRVRGESSDLEPVLENLPEGSDFLHLEGDTLWLGAEHGLYRVKSSASGTRLEPVIERPGINLRTLARGRLIDGDQLWLPDVGLLEQHQLVGDELQLQSEYVLPVSAKRLRRGLVLRSRPVSRLPSGVLVVGPEAAGDTRVRHLMITPGEAKPKESWSRLPAPEDVEDHWYLEIDGRPAFLAAATRSDRLGVFEKLKLRVFRMTDDRTRAGRAPMLAFETRTRNWYGVEPKILDWNGDGKDDLALIQPEGMGPGDLVIDIYKGRANRFDPKPLRTTLDAESARWHFGEDFDGDGVADLVVGTSQLAIYRGLAGHRRRVVDKKPWRQLTRGALRQARQQIATLAEAEATTDDRPSFRGIQRVVNLDNDEALEIAIVRSLEGRTVVRLVDLR